MLCKKEKGSRMTSRCPDTLFVNYTYFVNYNTEDQNQGNLFKPMFPLTFQIVRHWHL